MSATKLTLSIPKDVLFKAKVYSKKTRQPLSSLVTHYFQVLSLLSQKEDKGLSEKIKKVTGLAKSSQLDDDLLWQSIKDKHHLNDK